MLRILIADDHTIVQAGLRQILLDEFPGAHVEVVSDAGSLLKKVFNDSWSVIISDLSMPGQSGLDALAQIRQHYPKLPVLILSIHPEEQYALRVLKAGASGYLNKSLAAEELVTAVNRVLQGRKYITAAVAERLADKLDSSAANGPAHEGLSDREYNVFKLIASGKPVSEIAEMLSLGVTTVSTYRARILEKMNLKTNAELTRYAIENQLI